MKDYDSLIKLNESMLALCDKVEGYVIKYEADEIVKLNPYYKENDQFLRDYEYLKNFIEDKIWANFKECFLIEDPCHVDPQAGLPEYEDPVDLWKIRQSFNLEERELFAEFSRKTLL